MMMLNFKTVLNKLLGKRAGSTLRWWNASFGSCYLDFYSK